MENKGFLKELLEGLTYLERQKEILSVTDR